jgi:hypothetical protein
MILTETLPPPGLSSEKPWLKTLRITTGIALGIQTGLFMITSCIFGIFSLFIGGIAFLAGAGGATDQQIKTSGFMFLFMILYPFLWTTMLALSAINMLLQKRPMLIVIMCLLSIVSEISAIIYIATPAELDVFLSPDKDTGLKIFLLIIMIIPLAGMMVAVTMKRKQFQVKS